MESVESWRLKSGLEGGAAEFSEWKGGRVGACDELTNKTHCQQESAMDPFSRNCLGKGRTKKAIPAQSGIVRTSTSLGPLSTGFPRQKAELAQVDDLLGIDAASLARGLAGGCGGMLRVRICCRRHGQQKAVKVIPIIRGVYRGRPVQRPAGACKAGGERGSAAISLQQPTRRQSPTVKVWKATRLVLPQSHPASTRPAIGFSGRTVSPAFESQKQYC